MEVIHQGPGEGGLPAPIHSQSATIDLIRTETELSKYPVHNLAKKGSVNIQIVKRTPDGELELKWEVSYSDRYGQARQLAYRLDTIIINQRIDEAGRPLPRVLRIGSLNEICAELNVAAHAGQNAKDLKRAFLQNASAFITAKFNYKANDGTERHIEAGITRYGVVFTGEKLPDGRRADAVYVVFNDPFWEVLNSAPVRPLDRAYMKELPPAAQRFYEIVSRKIFAALKNNYPAAKIAYSEYCTFSAQLRHHERQRVQDQMAKVLRPHKESGYIIAVKYEPTIDAENKPDWILHLTPGPRARREFNAAHRGKLPPVAINQEGGGEYVYRRRAARRQHRLNMKPATEPARAINEEHVAALSQRGVADTAARKLLASLPPDQLVLDQLEWADQQIALAKARSPIINPAGFYISTLKGNPILPPTFESHAKREAREAAERQREEERRARNDLETEYEWYCADELERSMASLDPAELTALLKAKTESFIERGSSPMMAEAYARHEVKVDLRKRLPLMTIEEFEAKRREQPPVDPKLPLEEVELAVADLLPAIIDTRNSAEPEAAQADVTQDAPMTPPAETPAINVVPETPVPTAPPAHDDVANPEPPPQEPLMLSTTEPGELPPATIDPIVSDPNQPS